MGYARLIIAQVERQGYQCTGPRGCNRFHRPGDPAYKAHRQHATEGETYWTEIVTLGINDGGNVVRLPAALGMMALRSAAHLEEG